MNQTDSAFNAMRGIVCQDEPELELESIAIRVELDTPLNELFEVIRQAVSDLEGQGEKSDRIAEQLLAGMGKFCRETGCL